MIVHSTLQDIPVIEEIYAEARAFQQQQFKYCWPVFSQTFIETEIREKQHFKLVINGAIAAVFSVVRAEPVIWNDKEGKDALYLHRMAVCNQYKGKGIAGRIIQWAIITAGKEKRKYVRLDTWADNESLTQYYIQQGFELVGRKQLPAKSDLPEHYYNIEVNLFEIRL